MNSASHDDGVVGDVPQYQTDASVSVLYKTSSESNMSTFNDGPVHLRYALHELVGKNRGWEARKCCTVGDLNSFCNKIKVLKN